MTRWPVISGMLQGRRSATGRGMRIGQRWDSVSLWMCPFWSFNCAIVSLTLYFPLGFADTISPERFGGSISRWVISGVSGHSAYTSPPPKRSPGFMSTVTCHSRSGSRAGMLQPRPIKGPVACSMALSGRSIPSKMLLMIPGPSSTLIGIPVPLTGSPGRTLVVTS